MNELVLEPAGQRMFGLPWKEELIKALFIFLPVNPLNVKKNIASNISTNAWSTK